MTRLASLPLLVIAWVCALATPAVAAFTFDDIEYWVGSGANRAALVIDWVEDAEDPPALAWGFRWDGAATGRDMLMAVVAADDRLFAKLGNTSADPVRLYGLGYDTDADGQFGACRNLAGEIECTQFDEAGFAYSGEIFVAATAEDAGDFYREGWATGTGFWHYSIPLVPGTNPYDGGQWLDPQFGMTGRTLSDGDWDSWAFQLSTTPPFTSYAENPQAASPPNPLGDFNGNGTVDAADYVVWRNTQGSTTLLDADANGDLQVDAADYDIWKQNFGIGRVGNAASVPEPPASALVALMASFLAAGGSRGIFRSQPRLPRAATTAGMRGSR